MKLLGTFTSRLLKLGVNVDKVLLKRLYDNLDPRIKKNAEIILLPIATAKGVVYGMDNKTGMPVPFNFFRTSSATLFDSAKNLQLVNNDIPRIDYGNYTDSIKLLIEKESTNYALYSGNGNYNNLEVLFSSDRASASIVEDSKMNKAIYYLGGYPRYAQIAGLNTSVQYIWSWYLKGDTNYSLDVTDYSPVESPRQSVNITTEWDRYSKLKPLSYIQTTLHMYSNSKGLSIANIQLEDNGLSSYIPTTDAPATRSADLLRISLNRYARITIQTVNNGTIISDYITGDVDIHNLIPTNDAIVYLAIEYAPKVVSDFINNLNLIGVDIDEFAYINAYNSLSDDEKSAKIIFLPYAVSEGKVYAMDNTDGSVVEMSFRRSSSATLFNDDKEIISIGSNIPRIDHFNYSEDRKLLIEKQTTNYLTNSDFSTFSTERNNWVITSYVTTALDVDHTVYTIINSTGASRIQRTYNHVPGKYNISIYANAKTHIISFASFVNASIVTLASPRVNEYAIHHCNYSVPSQADVIIRPYLRNSESWDLNEQLFVKYIQIENSTGYTSFIPTSNSAVTRSADLLSIDLTQDSSVYLKTTKQEVILDKPAGVYNIHEDLSNEGILKLIIK